MMSDFHMDFFGGFSTNSLMFEKSYLINLEIVQPKQTNLKKLEVFQKNILKQILSLPTNAPDPAIYIISGLLPKIFCFLVRFRSKYSKMCGFFNCRHVILIDLKWKDFVLLILFFIYFNNWFNL
jgi:hypothetical protein